MDAHQFDRLTKTLAAGVPRRRVLKGLGGSLAGLLALGGLAAVEAAPCKSPNTRCGKGKARTCSDLQTDVNNCDSCGNVCSGPTRGPGSATCSGGNCGINCSGGTTLCGTTCADLQSDVKNCNTCGNVCPGDACHTTTCDSGNCNSAPNGCPSFEGEQCYWLNCLTFSNPCCWVPAPNGVFAPDRQSCEALNHCNEPGGACYKWANSSC